MFTYFSWWYAEEPAYIWKSIKIITKKVYHQFSVGLLLRTLFDPWKRDAVSVENASLDARFKVLIANLVSRFVGFMVRTITIIIGLSFTIFSFSILMTLILIWLIMPLIILYFLISGVSLVIGG